MGMFDDVPIQKRPEDFDTNLTWGEELAQKFLPEALGRAKSLRGTLPYRMMQGAADPVVGAVQLAANAVGSLPNLSPIKDTVNKAIKDEEAQYQDARKQIGSDGWDIARGVGNALATVPLAAVGGAPATLAGRIGAGALQGGIAGALEPVQDTDNYWTDKGKQIGAGTAGGAVMAPVVGAVSRIVSPEASTNAAVKLLKDEGVDPTVGQVLGGAWNTAEQKLSSLPIVGDMIRRARFAAVKDFNEAAGNRVLKPIGETAEGAGFDMVKGAQDKIGSAYDAALGSINHVNFDTPQFNAALGRMQYMADRLPAPLKQEFNDQLNGVVLQNMTPNGSMLPETFQAVNSQLKRLADGWSKDPNMLNRKLGDAFKQLRSELESTVASQEPGFAAAKKATDTAYAKLKTLENAAGRAKNNEGVFTPGQYNMAIAAKDTSLNKARSSAGDAFDQDLGRAAQSVLGNTYPDSGTVGRAALGLLGIGGGFVNPAIPASLIAGGAAYTRPVQNAIVSLITKRPDMAPQIANYLRQLTGPISLATVGAMENALQ